MGNHAGTVIAVAVASVAALWIGGRDKGQKAADAAQPAQIAAQSTASPAPPPTRARFPFTPCGATIELPGDSSLQVSTSWKVGYKGSQQWLEVNATCDTDFEREVTGARASTPAALLRRYRDRVTAGATVLKEVEGAMVPGLPGWRRGFTYVELNGTAHEVFTLARSSTELIAVERVSHSGPELLKERNEVDAEDISRTVLDLPGATESEAGPQAPVAAAPSYPGEQPPNYAVPNYAIPNWVPDMQKPVHVNGYTRRDGTVVQEHTRAAPGTGTGRHR